MRDEEKLWRPHCGRFAWPTIGLTSVVLGLLVLAWSTAIPLWASSVVATLAAYLGFTVMHEAAHGNVHGADRRWSWIGEVVGWIGSVPLFAPFPAFRVLHLRHHGHTNHPQKDPDYFVAGPLPIAMLTALVTIPSYYAHFLFGATSRTTAGKRARPTVVVGLVLYLGIAATLAAFGLWCEVLALWIGPAVAAGALLAFFFDWLPHRPHRSRTRYRDTGAIDLRALDPLLLGQNLHLVHHLFPRVPFYRYRAVFEAGRSHFEAQGAPIVFAGRKRNSRVKSAPTP